MTIVVLCANKASTCHAPGHSPRISYRPTVSTDNQNWIWVLRVYILRVCIRTDILITYKSDRVFFFFFNVLSTSQNQLRTRHTFKRIHTQNTHAHTHDHAHTHAYIHTHAHARAHTRTHAHKLARTRTHARTHMPCFAGGDSVRIISTQDLVWWSPVTVCAS